MIIRNIKTAINTMLASRNLKQIDLANKLNITKGNCSRLLNKEDFKINNDIIKIINLLDYDIEINFIDKKTGTIINCKNILDIDG